MRYIIIKKKIKGNVSTLDTLDYLTSASEL